MCKVVNPFAPLVSIPLVRATSIVSSDGSSDFDAVLTYLCDFLFKMNEPFNYSIKYVEFKSK